MRTVVVVLVQLILSFVVTASVMPLVLVTTAATQTNARLGMSVALAVMFVSFTLIALAWPKRLR